LFCTWLSLGREKNSSPNQFARDSVRWVHPGIEAKMVIFGHFLPAVGATGTQSILARKQMKEWKRAVVEFVRLTLSPKNFDRPGQNTPKPRNGAPDS